MLTVLFRAEFEEYVVLGIFGVGALQYIVRDPRGQETWDRNPEAFQAVLFETLAVRPACEAPVHEIYAVAQRA